MWEFIRFRSWRSRVASMEAIDATPVIDIKAVLAQSEDRCKTKRVLQPNITRHVAGLAATALLRVRHLLRD